MDEYTLLIVLKSGVNFEQERVTDWDMRSDYFYVKSNSNERAVYIDPNEVAMVIRQDPPKFDEEIKNLLAGNMKIKAIKLYREHKPRATLLEAKEYVERIEREMQ